MLDRRAASTCQWIRSVLQLVHSDYKKCQVLLLSSQVNGLVVLNQLTLLQKTLLICEKHQIVLPDYREKSCEVQVMLFGLQSSQALSMKVFLVLRLN